MTIMSNLGGARVKLQRARYHYETLEREISSFQSSQYFFIETIVDKPSKQKQARIRFTKDLPWEWAAIIGDLVFNLRSSLDLAVYQLTVLEKGVPLEMTEFPIFDDPKRYACFNKDGTPQNRSGIWKIRGVDHRVAVAIGNLQPFMTGGKLPQGQVPALSVIHELNIIDKHRTLHLCRQTTNSYKMDILRDISAPEDGNVFSIPIGEIVDGAVLATWWPVDDDATSNDVKIALEFDIGFGSSIEKLKFNSVLPTCKSMVTATSKILDILEEHAN